MSSLFVETLEGAEANNEAAVAAFESEANALVPFDLKEESKKESGADVRVLAILVACMYSGAALAGPVQENYPDAQFAVKIGTSTNIYPTTGKYGASQQFNVGVQQFEIDVNPLNPANRSNPNTATDVDFKNVLGTAFPTWTFKYYQADGTTDLSLANNSLVVKSYDVKNTSPVKMDFYMSYGSTAPPKVPSLHWIQVIKTNWKLEGSVGSLYTSDNKVDNMGAANPYYDTLGVASGYQGNPDSAFFLDQPSRSSAALVGYNGTPLYWYAEVYLAQQTAANTVALYDGVRWGWTVTAVPEPGFLQMGVLALIVATLLRAHRRKATVAS